MGHVDSQQVSPPRKWLLLGGSIFVWGLSFLSAAYSETYIAGQVGYTMAQDTTHGKAMIRPTRVFRAAPRFPMFVSVIH